MALRPSFGDPPRAPSSRSDQAGEEGPRARITQQFREPENMTYELDCSGLAVVIRIFFPTAGDWRVMAQASRERDAPGRAASAPSRLEAFRQVASACREGVDAVVLARVDWEAVEGALREVRAL